jgi:hypothetical protein
MRPLALPTARPRRTRQRLLGLAVLLVVAVSALPALAATDGDDGCADPLVTLAPEGADGDVTAVAVTSQMLEQGRDGWAQVGWETFGDTELDLITIVHSDGEVVRTDGLATGTATDVQQLIFCGSTGGRS